MEISDTVGQDFNLSLIDKPRRGRDRMVVGFTTTYAISAYRHRCCELESQSGRGVQHYVIKFVSDLPQVSGFLPVLLNLSLLMIENMTWVQAFLVQTQLRHHLWLYGSMTWHH